MYVQASVNLLTLIISLYMSIIYTVVHFAFLRISFTMLYSVEQCINYLGSRLIPMHVHNLLHLITINYNILQYITIYYNILLQYIITIYYILYDPNIDNNKEQKQAVENIVFANSLPYPYLVFGGPGSGNTNTMVEAIKQVK